MVLLTKVCLTKVALKFTWIWTYQRDLLYLGLEGGLALQPHSVVCSQSAANVHHDK